jgi:uncharacterized RDD family membrane protein YckC
MPSKISSGGKAMAFCSSCGSQVDQGTRFCSKCGRPVAEAAPLAQTPPATPATYASQPMAPPAQVYSPTGGAPAYVPAPMATHYGGFWIRFVAYFVDYLIIGVPLAVIIGIAIFAFGAFGGLSAIKNLSDNPDPNQVQQQIMSLIGPLLGAYALLFVFGIVIGWLYFALMESSPRQATFGKAMLNLKVTDANGKRLSFGHASGRFFSKIVTAMVPLGIGYIMAGFTAKKQALHDFIASTLVIKTN